MRVKIVNWNKFNNARKDLRSTTWFRFQNDYFIDPDFCDLPNDQKWVFPYLCSLASKKMSDEFDVSERLACVILKIEISALHSALEHLKDRGIIEIPTLRTRKVVRTRQSTSSVTDTTTDATHNGTVRNGTERNGTKEHHAVSPPVADDAPSPRRLVELWNEIAHPNMPRVDLESFKAATPRWRSANARLKEKPDLGYWRGVIERLNQSAFCRGEVEPRDGRKAFVASFAFLVRGDSHVKAMEGLYDQGRGSPAKRKNLTPLFTTEAEP